MWKCQYTRRFLKELAALPAFIERTVRLIAFDREFCKNPFSHERIQMEKLSGYEDYYKIRIGNYRIGIEVFRDERIARFSRVLHRKDFYRHFP